MENFIIILISIGFVIYNLYKNYQKEMEKSKSRRPNVRPQPIPADTYIPYIEKVRTKETKIKSKEVIFPSERPQEVLAVQKRKKVRNIEKPIPINRFQEPKTESNEIEFDLRRAIIQSAILERPYK